MRRSRSAVVTAFACAVAATAQAQTATTLDAKARAEIIDALTSQLNRAYVFPEKAGAMEQHLRAQANKGAYSSVTDPSEFARLLTSHLQNITHDKHLRVGFGARRAPAPSQGGAPERPRPFGDARRLDGNVAYVEIRSFGFPAQAVRDETRNIMSAAADASALIIDLRNNGGGSPDMVALVSSYLFGDERVLLNSLYWRVRDRTDDFYTDPKVEGKKFGPTKPVFVLTSGNTFSAAEEFTYNLQTRKRAIIVGDTTGGGAHPGGGVTLPHGFSAFIPSGRAINPITKTNWEGTGVRPDVAVSAANALETAHKLAVQRIKEKK
jgi:hypothetical protein